MSDNKREQRKNEHVEIAMPRFLISTKYDLYIIQFLMSMSMILI